MFNERIDCTKEVLEELAAVYKDNPFLMFCVDLHNWAMKKKKDLIYYEDPYILKDSRTPIMRQLPTRPRLDIKRPGKYAFSVDSEKAAKKLQTEAVAILKANNKIIDKKNKNSTYRISLNSKVLPASHSVKLSVGPAYSVGHPSVENVMKVFYKKLSDIKADIKDTDDAELKDILNDSYRELSEQIKEWESIFEERFISKLTVAARCGKQYRFSYYDFVEEKRCQAGFGDVIIFYGSPKPTLSLREPSKKRTDTRENDPGLLYHGDYEGMEAYISI